MTQPLQTASLNAPPTEDEEHDWRSEVANGDTRLGLVQWTRDRRLASAENEADDATPNGPVLFEVRNRGELLGYVSAPEDEYDDKPLIYLQRVRDGALVAGIQLDSPDDATIGHWPNGEEWVDLFDAPVVPSTG